MGLGIFESLPLWGFLLLTVIGSLVAYEIGFRLGSYFHSHGHEKAPMEAMVTSMLGLLAFILAFTFGFAGDLFTNRRTAVLEEANAIEATYLRSTYLPKPYRENIPPLLKEYVTLRLEAVKGENIPTFLETTESIQTRLWNQVVAMVDEGHTNDMYALFVESITEMTNLHEKRVLFTYGMRVPNIVWAVLFELMVVSIGAMGYLSGFRETRRMGVSLLVIISFSSVIFLIADIEHSREGFINVSQQPLVDVLKLMQQDNIK